MRQHTHSASKEVRSLLLINNKTVLSLRGTQMPASFLNAVTRTKQKNVPMSRKVRHATAQLSADLDDFDALCPFPSFCSAVIQAWSRPESPFSRIRQSPLCTK